jgi:hypothetical protein
MGEGAIVAIVLGIITVGGVAAYAISSSSSTPATSTTPANPAPTPAATPTVCARATTINPHDHVRVSFTQAQWATIAQQAGVTSDISGLEQFLTTASAQQALGTTQISAWSPGNALPADWPADDTNAATEYHLDFIYGGPAAFQTTAFPLTGAIFWTCTAGVAQSNLPNVAVVPTSSTSSNYVEVTATAGQSTAAMHVGQTLEWFANWTTLIGLDPTNPVSSDSTILNPTTTSAGAADFVGVAPGTATLSGSYTDGNGNAQTATLVVTVAAAGQLLPVTQIINNPNP